MELLLIRHALPVRTEAAEGPADPALAPGGLRQAEALASWLAGEEVDAIYTSPLRRARQTAAPVATALGLGPTVLDGLAEWDRDAEAYIPIEELQAANDPIWQQLALGRAEDLEALGIDVEAFRHRVDAAIDGIVRAHPGGRAAVVCHGGVINSYVAGILGLDRLLFFAPGYTAINRILVSGSGIRSIGSLNELSHLRDLDRPRDRASADRRS